MSRMESNMSLPKAILCVILSALSLSLGIPNELLPGSSILLGFAALVPLYTLLRSTRSWSLAAVYGGFMMMSVHLISSFWLAYFKEFAIFTLGASALAYLVMGLLAGWLLKYSLSFPSHLRPFVFAAVWTVWEWFKSIGFLAYPWGTLMMSAPHVKSLIQIADITGAWGVSFLIALCSSVCAELLAQNRFRPFSLLPVYRSLLFTAFVLLLTLTYGNMRLSTLPASEESINVVLVQQNTDPWDEPNAEVPLLVSQRLTREAILNSPVKPDLVIWSESVLPWPYQEYRNHYALFPRSDPFRAFLSEIDTPLLVGAPVLVNRERKEYANSVILLSPDGKKSDWYGKIQLVPFAEYMPFTEYAWVRKTFDTLVGFSSGWQPGTEFKSLSVKTRDGRNISFATPICFEDAFASHVARLYRTGSSLLINLTNDSWSKTDSAEMQHYAIASFRAIELRTTLIRSTNAGYSAVIDPAGTILYDMPLFTEAAISANVPIYRHGLTFYARFGDWLPTLFALLLAVLFAYKAILDILASRTLTYNNKWLTRITHATQNTGFLTFSDYDRD